MQHIIKTICTIGPASEKPDVLEELVVNGMDIARMNFSHATEEEFLKRKKLITEFNTKHNRDVKILMDLQGPRMRVGILPDEGILLAEGDIQTFTTNKQNTEAIYINDPYLHEDIQINHPLFLTNGEMELMVIDKKGTEIVAKVIRGGTLFSRKAVNIPETNLTTRGLTEKDKKDVLFGVAQNVDCIAMSFVKDGQDIEDLRQLINNPAIKICAKIEIKQAINHLDEIIQASDWVMVARGDLGVELPVEEIPLLQKEIISLCRRYNTPSIVATQMLLSMVTKKHPTRAEVSDVANAVFDGASAVMLSDESAFGEYPIRSLQSLSKIAHRAEEYQAEQSRRIPLE